MKAVIFTVLAAATAGAQVRQRQRGARGKSAAAAAAPLVGSPVASPWPPRTPAAAGGLAARRARR